MQLIIFFLKDVNEFAIIDFAKSTKIANMPVASGQIRYFNADDFLSNAERYITESIEGYPTRIHQVSELFETLSELQRAQFFGRCLLSFLLSHIPKEGVVNVRDRLTGAIVERWVFPLDKKATNLFFRNQLDALKQS